MSLATNQNSENQPDLNKRNAKSLAMVGFVVVAMVALKGLVNPVSVADGKVLLVPH